MAQRAVACAVLAAAAAVLAVAVASPQGDGLMSLELVHDAVAAGAVCLDGSAPGYYVRRSPGGVHANDWVVFFQGGGWCYTPEDCLARSTTALGSSSSWAAFRAHGGILSGNATANPDFYDWNAMYIQYCDGSSYSSNVDEPVVVNGKTLYYRGFRVLNALLHHVETVHNMANATSVLVSGCSAGGLATYLHADFIASRHSTQVKVKAVPESGYFLDFPNQDGTPVYTKQMQNVFSFQNVSAGLNRECMAKSSNQWQCYMAQYAFGYMTVPTFIVNSAYDAWQMGNVVGIDVPNWNSCAYSGPGQCTTAQLDYANKFHDDMSELITNTPKFNAPGNGGFIFTCWNHCAGSNDGFWNQLSINGVSMRQAVADWWYERPNANQNRYLPCRDDDTTKKDCNPACLAPTWCLWC